MSDVFRLRAARLEQLDEFVRQFARASLVQFEKMAAEIPVSSPIAAQMRAARRQADKEHFEFEMRRTAGVRQTLALMLKNLENMVAIGSVDPDELIFLIAELESIIDERDSDIAYLADQLKALNESAQRRGSDV